MSKKPEKGSQLYNIRHSLAHMLAQAVLNMFPEAKLGTGPVTENGFYYDFDLPRPLIPEDLPLLEKAMKKQVKQNQLFVRRDEPIREAKAFLKKIKQPYKIELVNKFVDQQGIKQVSFYENVIEQTQKGVFVDLCEGGHVDNTKELDANAFRLSHTSSAYWQADENNASMQRIYGISFETVDELKAYDHMMEEAKKRDHRKLGQELKLYTIDERVGAGLPLWLPNGAVIVEEIEKLAKESELAAGYKRVRTPHIAKGDLYRTSGHLPYYADSMYPPMQMENEEYYLKAMNCPHHHIIYSTEQHSYRTLPLRLAEYGHCYRFEDSGALFGLMRVRSLSMNDAHIYCTPDQFRTEFLKVIDLYKYYFKIFGIEKFQMRLSLHAKSGLGKKYVDEPELWIQTEHEVREAMKSAEVPFVEVEDEAAFYGPKIDVQIWSVIGREFTLATNQLDFAVPKRFNLTYVDADGKEKTPLCIHRAPLSTHERLIGFLVEHFAGAFPTWLAPVQVEVIPIAESHLEYGQNLVNELRANGIRVELSEPSDTLGKRIRNSEMQKIPYMIVVGDKEIKSGHVNARSYATKEQKDYGRDEFIAMVKAEIEERRLPVVSEEEKEKLARVAARQKEEEKNKSKSSPKKSFGAKSSKNAVKPESHDLYNNLIALLDENKAKYRLIDHAPEGRTDIVSPMRGNKVSDAAKCMILMLKIGKKETKYILAVVPGDARVDFDAIKKLYGASYVSFADQERAEELAGSVAGTVLPFAFHEDLELLVDPKILEIKELFFNAARLDRSMALNTKDYEKLIKASTPRLENIAKYNE